ncbi:hypothetical protein EV702DRAFT_980823, partial [Suillus placidus]
VHVDEAHNISTAGLSHHRKQAFQPAYSKLGEPHVLLCKGTSFQALPATFPSHILSTVQHELMMSWDHISLALSINHANIMYATTLLVNFVTFAILTV